MKASKCVFLRPLMPWFTFAPGSVLINVKLCSLTHLCYSKSCKLFFFEKQTSVLFAVIHCSLAGRFTLYWRNTLHLFCPLIFLSEFEQFWLLHYVAKVIEFVSFKEPCGLVVFICVSALLWVDFNLIWLKLCKMCRQIHQLIYCVLFFSFLLIDNVKWKWCELRCLQTNLASEREGRLLSPSLKLAILQAIATKLYDCLLSLDFFFFFESSIIASCWCY